MDRRRFPSATDGPPGCCICFAGFTGRGYNDSRKERVPLVLKCTHSSCENCILSFLKVSKAITCAVCGELSPFPPREEDIRAMFPVNMHLLGLWSRRTKEYFDGADSQISFPKTTVKKEIAPKKCFTSCNECTGPANSFCESCLTAYCHLCFKKVHAAAKVLKDHKSVSLIQELGTAAVKNHNAMCSVHRDKKLELFCTQCHVSICSSCLVSEHNGHNLKSIADKNKEFVDEIIASYARATDIMHIMKASTKLENDLVNFVFFKGAGKQLKMKPHVVPRFNLNSPRIRRPEQSQVSDSSKKRKRKFQSMLSLETETSAKRPKGPEESTGHVPSNVGGSRRNLDFESLPNPDTAMSVPLVSPVENLAVPLSDSPVSEGIGIERNTTTAQTHETAGPSSHGGNTIRHPSISSRFRPRREESTESSKAKQALKCSSGASSNASHEQRIKNHFVELHGHLEILENELLNKLNSSSRVTSLNAAIEKLSDNIDRTRAILAKTKSFMKSEGCVEFMNLLSELRELENLPCVLVATEHDTDLNCLSIDLSIFYTLNEHIVLRSDDAVSYQLKTENDAPDEALEDLPKSCSLDEVKSQLLPPQPIKPSNSNAGSLPTDYAVEKSGRAASPLITRWSSSSSLSSNNSFAVETTQLLVPPDDLVVGITFKACVSHMNSPSDLWIQRFGVRRKLDSLQRELRRYGTNYFHKKRDDAVYQAGQYYMTMYSGDYNWSRCQILDFIGTDEVKILYIDFGNHEKVLKSRLRPLPEVLAQIPALAVRCSIVNCYPRSDNEWDPKVVTVMSRMIEGKGCISITIVRKNQLNCLTIKLYKETETNVIDVGEALVFLEYAQCGPAESFTPDLEISTRPKPFPAQIVLNAEEVLYRTFEMSHVVSPDEFYIVTSPMLVDLKVMYRSLNKDYNMVDKRMSDSRIVYYPAVGMAVAVPNEEGCYRRALVIEMLPKKIVKIFLVDEGATQLVDWHKLRTLKLEYFKLPPQAYRCSMTDIQPIDGKNWPEGAVALLESYVGKTVRIANPEFMKLHTRILLIHSDIEVDVCVNALLVREGFAKSTGPYGDIVEYPKVPNLVTSNSPVNVNPDQEFKIVQRPKQLELPPVKSVAKEEMDLDDELITKDPNGPYKLRVTVLRVINPGEFYVTFDYVDDKYKELNNEMNEFYKNVSSNELERKWQLDDKCAVKAVDGSWKRGVVIKKPDGTHLEIKLVDEAAVVSVSTTTPGVLAVLDSRFLKLLDRTFQCILGGIVAAGSSSWTLTSITEMSDFLATYKNNLYITKMKQLPDDGPNVLRVLLFGKRISKPTATRSECVSWPSLNHKLRWKGCAKADEYTKWDHMGNLIDERNNAMEDEEEVLNSLLRSAFHMTPEGAVDLSRPVSECPEVVKIKWFPAEPLANLTFMGKTTFVGSNCEIWVQDTLNASVTLNVINDEATKLCEGTEPPNPPIQWEAGDICLARFHIDNKWYRSEICQVNITPSHHLVRFVDYGNEEFLGEHELRLADGTTMRPIQAHICYFDNLAPIGGTWLASHIHEIHTLLVEKYARIELRELANNLLGIKSLVLPDGKNALNEIVSRRLGIYRTLAVADSRKACPKSDSTSAGSNATSTTTQQNTAVGEGSVEPQEEGAVANALRFTNWWLKIYESDDKYELPDEGFQLLTIPSDVNKLKVDITSLLSPELCLILISASDNEELNSILNSYKELVETMQQEAESQPSLEPPYLYKDCCCKFEADDMWYRAVVLHDSSDVDGSLIIQFVDYGNVQRSTVDQVKQMRGEWFSVPVQSIPCLIEGYTFRQDVSESEAMICLQNVLIDQPFVKAVIKKREKNLLVEFYNEEGNLLYQPLIDSQQFVPSASCSSPQSDDEEL